MISCNQALIHGKFFFFFNLTPRSISIFNFIFNCVLFKKIRRRSLDDVAFTEFDRNPNFVPDDILFDVVARLRNQRNYSPDGFRTS
jgi:hypothetical protein